METFAIPAGSTQNCHEVAHWKLFCVMETFGIPSESFQCAHEVNPPQQSDNASSEIGFWGFQNLLIIKSETSNFQGFPIPYDGNR